MCGISGIWNLSGKPVDRSDAKFLLQELNHRGPDNNGQMLLLDKSLCLLHNRLSILDITDSGKQPMQDPETGNIIVYNGEVFNYLEIRNELKKKGISFFSETDTEVVLKAYRVWGWDCLHKFNGMWAFALFDNSSRQLTLVRDRYGIKPLYYLYKNNQLIFASEVEPILKLKKSELKLNKHVIKSLLKAQFSHHHTSETYVDEIKSIQNGELLRISERELSRKKWYKFEKKNVPSGYKKQVNQLKNLIEDSCKLRLRSDVPVATCLSGGLDSSSIVSTCNKIKGNYKQFVHTSFCAGFPNSFIDETFFAKKLSEGLETPLDILQVRAPGPQEVEKQIEKCDGPMHSMAFYPINKLYEHIAENNIKVTLDGQGPDEMLGGYGNTYKEFFKDAVLNKSFHRTADLWYTYRTASKNNRNKKNIDRYALSSFKKILTDNSNFYDGHTGAYSAQINQFFKQPLPSILNQFDRCSMASSIECRMPFMDFRIVEMLLSLPSESKVSHGYKKRILRDATKDIMPASVNKRKTKIGFNSPVREWLRQDLKGWASDIISGREFENNPYIDTSTIRKYFGELIEREKPHGGLANTIWPSLHFIVWYDKIFN